MRIAIVLPFATEPLPIFFFFFFYRSTNQITCFYFILIEFENGTKCNFIGRIRHHGDEKDHISLAGNAIIQSIDVHLDSVSQQVYSCVANGKLYNDSEIAILAAVVKGVDITEIFSPERVTKLCRKYGLVAGDSHDLRDG